MNKMNTNETLNRMKSLMNYGLRLKASKLHTVLLSTRRKVLTVMSMELYVKVLSITLSQPLTRLTLLRKTLITLADLETEKTMNTQVMLMHRNNLTLR
jgi:hypothetical protein